MKAIRLPLGAPMYCIVAASIVSLTINTATATYSVRAERQSVSTFVGVEELNRIIVTGADSRDLIIKVTYGYGEFKLIADEWYWSFTPSVEDITDSKFVRFEAQTKNVTAPDRSKTIEGDFIMSVEKPLWSSEWPYWPLGREYQAAYAGIGVSVDYKCKGMDGQYHLVIEKNGKYWRDVYEPNYDFELDRSDVGSKLTFNLYYFSSPKATPALINRNTVTVEEAPFGVTNDRRASAGEYIRIAAWMGTDGTYILPTGPILIVKSDGYLSDTAYHVKQYADGVKDELDDGDKFFSRVRRDAADTTLTDTYDYLVRVTNKARSISKCSRVKFRVTYPITGQQCESSVVLGKR
jgi:hypothetical protein